MMAQLLTKFHNLAIDGAIGGRVSWSLNGRDDLLTGVHRACMAGQETQQSELGFRQRKRPAFNQNFIRFRPEKDPVDFEGVGFVEHCGSRLPQMWG